MFASAQPAAQRGAGSARLPRTLPLLTPMPPPPPHRTDWLPRSWSSEHVCVNLSTTMSVLCAWVVSPPLLSILCRPFWQSRISQSRDCIPVSSLWMGVGQPPPAIFEAGFIVHDDARCQQFFCRSENNNPHAFSQISQLLLQFSLLPNSTLVLIHWNPDSSSVCGSCVFVFLGACSLNAATTWMRLYRPRQPKGCTRWCRRSRTRQTRPHRPPKNNMPNTPFILSVAFYLTVFVCFRLLMYLV